MTGDRTRTSRVTSRGQNGVDGSEGSDSKPTHPPTPSRRTLFTVNGLADFLAVDRATVYRLPIPYVLVGSRRRYRPKDVDAYLEESLTPANQGGRVT